MDEAREQGGPVGARVGADDGAGTAPARCDGDRHLTEHRSGTAAPAAAALPERASRARLMVNPVPPRGNTVRTKTRSACRSRMTRSLVCGVILSEFAAVLLSPANNTSGISNRADSKIEDGRRCIGIPVAHDYKPTTVGEHASAFNAGEAVVESWFSSDVQFGLRQLAKRQHGYQQHADHDSRCAGHARFNSVLPTRYPRGTIGHGVSQEVVIAEATERQAEQ